MLIAEGVLIPTKVLEDIISPESKKCILTALTDFRDTKCELAKAKTTIAELEQQVDDLQKALDTVLLNKCRTRKVKVKVYGRTQDVRKNSNR